MDANKFLKCPKCNDGCLEKVVKSFNMYKCNKCGESIHGTEIN